MKLGLALPSFVEDPEIPIAVAVEAEASGLDGVFVYDHLWRERPPPRRPAIECFTLLGAVAAETARVMVGTLVARASLRPAPTLVAGFDTAQRISGGRLIAGIGAGDSESRGENEAYGLEFGNQSERIVVLADAVDGARNRGYPVWVGGNAARVRHVVARADGWNGWGASVDEFAARAALVQEIAPAAALTWGGLVLVGRDERDAREKADRLRAGPHVVFGGPEHVAAGLVRYRDAGASWAVVAPIDASEPENATILGDVRAALAR